MITVGTPFVQGNNGVFDGNSYIYTDGFPAFSDKDYSITGSFSISSWPTGFQDPAIFGYNDPVTVNPLGLLIGADADGFTRLLFDNVEATTSYASGTEVVISPSSRFCVGKGGSTLKLFDGTVFELVVEQAGTQIH